MKYFIALVIAGFLSVTLIPEAQARVVIINTVNLRAGPDTDYPVVVRLRRNAGVQVYGCIDDWYWCDVSSGPYRGWVRSDYIATDYDNRRVTYIEAAPRLNVPIISFNLGYWDTYYHDRPFYRDRGRWENHGWRGRDRGWHGRDHDNDHDHDHDNDHSRGKHKGWRH